MRAIVEEVALKCPECRSVLDVKAGFILTAMSTAGFLGALPVVICTT